MSGRHSPASQRSLQQEVEDIEVDADKAGQRLILKFLQQAAIDTDQPRQGQNRFTEAVDHKDADRGYGLETFCQHQLATDPGELNIRHLRPQSAHESGAEPVSRRFARNNANDHERVAPLWVSGTAGSTPPDNAPP